MSEKQKLWSDLGNDKSPKSDRLCCSPTGEKSSALQVLYNIITRVDTEYILDHIVYISSLKRSAISIIELCHLFRVRFLDIEASGIGPEQSNMQFEIHLYDDKAEPGPH